LTSQHVAEIGDAEELNELQKQALDLIKAKKNVFVTGSAGTGKSFLLHHVLKYVRNTYKRHEWVATASTGSAAIPLGGQTLHSFAGVGVPGVVKDFEKAWNKSDKWRGLQVLIIDEISMISGEFLDLLSNVVSQIRGK
jgi:ATP-dependent DNA helicase PIF1